MSHLRIHSSFLINIETVYLATYNKDLVAFSQPQTY